jgi:small conductance mechanosensitive channel
MRGKELLTQIAAQVDIQLSPDLILRLALVALILVATYAVSRLLGGFVSRAFGKVNLNMARQARRVTAWITWLAGTILALDQLGLELTWLLVVVAVGIVVAIIIARDFFSNIAARETISMYNQFKIGDWVQVGKIFGRVVDITWNDTILSTPNNETVYIPNLTITRSVVINRTKQEGIRISIPITVNNSVDTEEIEEALLKIGTELQEELVPESKPEVRLTSVKPETTKLELLLRINNPAKTRLVTSEVLKRIKKKTKNKQ